MNAALFHRLLWSVLGVIPFGEDDTAEVRETLLALICLSATVVVIVWTRHRRTGGEALIDGIGSVLAAGAVCCELLQAQRLFWTLAVAVTACAAYLRYLGARCILCGLTGAGQHREH